MNAVWATNITWHEGHVKREDREQLLAQTGATVWFTGLSGSGKSTIAFTLEHALIERGRLAYVLDGDNIRHGLNKNLGFSAVDREENIRRIGEVARLFADTGAIALTSFISPYRQDRDLVRQMHRQDGLPFIEVLVDVPIEICETRDPKGLYKKARAAMAEGKGMGFTGVDDPYEQPLSAEIVIRNDRTTPQEAAAQVIAYMESRGMLPAVSRGLDMPRIHKSV
jgi:adenylylsulfate kinase